MNKFENRPRCWNVGGKLKEDLGATLMQSRRENFKEAYNDILLDASETVDVIDLETGNDEDRVFASDKHSSIIEENNQLKEELKLIEDMKNKTKE